MIIVMAPNAESGDVVAVSDLLDDAGNAFRTVRDQTNWVIVTGDEVEPPVTSRIMSFPSVQRVIRTAGPGRLVSREYLSKASVVDVGGVAIGGGTFVVVAGPCAVESPDQLMTTARAVADAGARILRGDAFKPRTSPYSFQGLGEDGLKILSDARDETGLPFVVEVLDPRDVPLVSSYADMLRIGTRNMSNYALLREVGRQPKPVMLKRGRTSTVEEWLSAAEYTYTEGNPNIVLVERGIRTFETETRNTLDISAVALAKGLTHLPVLVDPSHAAGRSDIVAALARASLAVGADGVMVDVHPDPDGALVDGAQALRPGQFESLMRELRSLSSVMGESL